MPRPSIPDMFGDLTGLIGLIPDREGFVRTLGRASEVLHFASAVQADERPPIPLATARAGVELTFVARAASLWKALRTGCLWPSSLVLFAELGGEGGVGREGRMFLAMKVRTHTVDK